MKEEKKRVYLSISINSDEETTTVTKSVDAEDATEDILSKFQELIDDLKS